MRKPKQNHPRRLLSEQERFEDRRLAASFLRMASALDCRPEPRHLFDNVASPGRVTYRGHDAVVAGKAAMRAAIQTARRETMEATAERITLFFDDLKSAALADYLAIVNGDISLSAACVKASKEGSEALHAIVLSTTHEQADDLTIREIDEAIQAFSDLRARMLTDVSAPRNRRPALALS